MEKRLTYKNLPVAAQMSLETEEKLQDQKVLERKVQKNGLIPTVVEIFQNPGLEAREVHVNLEAQDDESAFDYEWDLESEDEERKTPSGRKEDESEEYDYDSSEESHEEEIQESLMGEIFSRVNNVIAGQPIEHNDMQRMRQNAGHWIRRAKQNMKWAEDYKDYESLPESQNGAIPAMEFLRIEERKQWVPTACQTLKTHYVRDNGRMCFTTRPVPACASGCQPSGDKQVTRDFHCLPLSSPFTSQLVAETERNVLSRLVNKRVDFTRPISAPVSCSA